MKDRAEELRTIVQRNLLGESPLATALGTIAEHVDEMNRVLGMLEERISQLEECCPMARPVDEGLLGA